MMFNTIKPTINNEIVLITNINLLLSLKIINYTNLKII